MAKTESATYKITLEKLESVIENIKDLTKLDKSIILKFDKNNLLLYSLVGKGMNIHAFKSHTLKIKDVFTSQIDLKNSIKYKIEDAKKFVTSMMVFIKYMQNQKISDTLEFSLTYQENFIVEKLTIKNKKSKEITPGEKPAPNQDIDIDQIQEVMNIDLSSYSFDLSKEDFNYIKSKTVIEKENDILYLNVKDNQVTIGETRWEHNICGIEYEDSIISFPKKYFKCINYDKENVMKIYVTETYLMIIGENTNLLISIELTI